MIEFGYDFLKHRLQKCAPATIYDYQNALFKVSTMSETLYPDILPDFIRFLRAQDKLSNVSVRTYGRNVRVFLNYVARHHLVDFDFNLDVSFPRSDAELVEPLTSLEVSLIDSFLLAGCKRNYLCFHLMLDCGLRLGEVLSLSEANFHWKDCYIQIHRTKSAAPRIVPIPQKLLSKLWLYQFTVPPYGAFFDISESGWKSFMYRLKRSTGVKRLHSHLLRHTFGTSFVYYKMGDLERLRLLMGHSDISVTCNYLHLSGLYELTKLNIYKIDDVFSR